MLKWTTLDIEHAPNRCAMSSVLYKNYLIIFGGDDRIGGGNKHDTWRFDLISNKWEEIQTKGNKPTEREGHTSILYKDSMIVFAGFDISRESKNDLHELNLLTNCWRTIIPTTPLLPSKRQYHSAVGWNHYMFVFGGDDTNKCNDVWIFDFIEEEWLKKKVTGQIPEKRSEHSALVYKDSMYIFGGMDDSGNMSVCRNLYEFNLITLNWTLIKCPEEEMPSARFAHSAVLYDHYMLIIGGFENCVSHLDVIHAFDLHTYRWNRWKTQNNVIERRYHTSVCFKDKLYIFGGENTQITAMDNMQMLKFPILSYFSKKCLQKFCKFYDIQFEMLDNSKKRKLEWNDEFVVAKKSK